VRHGRDAPSGLLSKIQAAINLRDKKLFFILNYFDGGFISARLTY
jgi:hypothetical protein